MIAVAAGVLRNAAGQCLIAQRPAGKIAAGKWEFPGGKIEANEAPEQALIRELREELAIEVLRPQPLIQVHHDYHDRTVHMWVFELRNWRGEPRATEGQTLAWSEPSELWSVDLLAADGPIIRALELPRCLPISPEASSLSALRSLALRWANEGYSHARLRLPDRSDTEYKAIAETLVTEATIAWILDRCPQHAAEIGAAGFHLRSQALAALQQRAVPDTMLCGASVHDTKTWSRARELGVDYAMLSPVRSTASHPERSAIGWPAFESIVASGSLPTYALGGVGPADLTESLGRWAQGVTGIRAFCD